MRHRIDCLENEVIVVTSIQLEDTMKNETTVPGSDASDNR